MPRLATSPPHSGRVICGTRYTVESFWLFDNRIVFSPCGHKSACGKAYGVLNMNNVTFTWNDNTFAMPKSIDDDTLALFADALGVPTASVLYTMNYGWKQSVSDARAQVSAGAVAEGKTGDELIKLCVAAMQKRAEAIVAGTVRTAGTIGVTRDPFGAMVRRVAMELMRKVATKKGKKLPKDKDALSAILAKFTEANKVAIENEAKERLAFEPDLELDM